MMKAVKLFVVFFAVLGLMVVATAASAADMTGTWDVSVQTPQGSGTPTFVLKQDGNKLSGDYEGAFGTSKVAGSVDGNNFIIEYTMSGTKIVYSGTIDGNKIKGTAKFGPDASGPFTGERAK
jgi:hypothetical protein